ncbi:MAG: hypothetical protein MZU95_11915 [Desulfomicrobium escambiense]|nr:hypothetical protein [Desulfomicrobium escambiense]
MREGGSTGMLTGVEALDALSRERGWTYLAAIATDYMTGRHDGDDKKYVYLGTVGKLLPSIYVHAEQSHVGESFKGLDANFIASWLMSRIDMNPALSRCCGRRSNPTPSKPKDAGSQG